MKTTRTATADTRIHSSSIRLFIHVRVSADLVLNGADAVSDLMQPMVQRSERTPEFPQLCSCLQEQMLSGKQTETQMPVLDQISNLTPFPPHPKPDNAIRFQTHCLWMRRSPFSHPRLNLGDRCSLLSTRGLQEHQVRSHLGEAAAVFRHFLLHFYKVCIRSWALELPVTCPVWFPPAASC